MIALCLQCCPVDTDAAMDLANLICQLEKETRAETEFFLVYRKDCDIRLPKFFEELALMRFGTAKACMARNHDVGWPGGANMLASSAMMEMSSLRSQGLCKSPAYLLFEPDCVPMGFDWIDRLSEEWEVTEREGKQAFGHWHQQGDPSTLHMNGNAVFCTDFYDKHGVLIGPALQGWDYFYREKIIGVSRDSNLIYQWYGCPSITLEALSSLRKNGIMPALFHGVKDSSARQNVRIMVVRDASA
jgi:hypothetical protein